ncbi:murein hydrolase activator EnvC family protein [Streptomyces sp. NPDC059101]|uniref:murein hydrolase activator EnvC family protein n=1 Tax=Streptomyces sp. NPDC059101 TaxID=3346728 RepID=UPI0036A1BD58
MRRLTGRTERRSRHPLPTPSPSPRQHPIGPRGSAPTRQQYMRQGHRTAPVTRRPYVQRAGPRHPLGRRHGPPASPTDRTTPNRTVPERAPSVARDRRGKRHPLPAFALLAVCALSTVPTVGVIGAASPAEASSPYGGAARATGAATPAPEGTWPVDGPGGTRPAVLRGWEPPPAPWAAGHRGVDLAATDGSVVKAATPGQVTFTGTVAGRGVLTIEVAHSGHPPSRTTYEPVRATSHKGQHITAGQPVGVLEHGPYHCRAPCLHWGLRRGTTYLNPLSLLPPTALRIGHSRLLPVFGIPETTPIPELGPDRPHREQPVPTTHTAKDASTGTTATTLLGAVALTSTALWAFGRLRQGAGEPSTARRRSSVPRAASRKRQPGRGRRGGNHEERHTCEGEAMPTQTT